MTTVASLFKLTFDSFCVSIEFCHIEKGLKNMWFLWLRKEQRGIVLYQLSHVYKFLYELAIEYSIYIFVVL